MLFNIHSQEWDQELLDLFEIPASLLPEVKSCSEVYCETAGSQAISRRHFSGNFAPNQEWQKLRMERVAF